MSTQSKAEDRGGAQSKPQLLHLIDGKQFKCSFPCSSGSPNSRHDLNLFKKKREGQAGRQGVGKARNARDTNLSLFPLCRTASGRQSTC